MFLSRCQILPRHGQIAFMEQKPRPKVLLLGNDPEPPHRVLLTIRGLPVAKCFCLQSGDCQWPRSDSQGGSQRVRQYNKIAMFGTPCPTPHRTLNTVSAALKLVNCVREPLLLNFRFGLLRV